MVKTHLSRYYSTARSTTLKAAILGAAIPLLCTMTASPAAHAEQPYGWIGNDRISAYTLAPLKFEISGHYLWLNSSVDAFGVRDDIRGSNPALVGDSGELEGQRGAIRMGLWHGLDIFYQRQDQDLTLEIAPDARAGITRLDDRQETRSTAWGAKWVFYEARFKNRNRGWQSAALELIREDNRSDDFTGYLQPAPLAGGSDTSQPLSTPQRFALDNLKDDRWQARLIYTTPFANSHTMTTWLSYGESESSAGTRIDSDVPELQEAFRQSLDIDEKQFSAGISLNLQGRPRLPVQLSYEYIHVHDRKERIASLGSPIVPGFLRDGPRSSRDSNHVVTASANWWVTPHMYVGATALVASQQYTGVMPHFNNPLTGSLSDERYAHMELKLGIRFGGLRR